MQMNALPPRHVYSASVTNALQEAAAVVVTYTLPDNKTETVEFKLDAGASVAAEQKTVSMGSWTATAHIGGLSVTSASGKKVEGAAPFNVHSPVKDYKFTIAANGDDLAITEG